MKPQQQRAKTHGAVSDAEGAECCGAGAGPGPGGRAAWALWALGASLVLQAAVSFSLYGYIARVEREVREVREVAVVRGPEGPVGPGPGSGSGRVRRGTQNQDFMEDNAVPSSYGLGSGTTLQPYGMEKGSWIMSLSKIPVDTVQTFCKQHCPAGPPGSPGPMGHPGSRGERGDRGERGERGVEGPRGERGERGYLGEPGGKGPKGDKGSDGRPGLDGRDGVPGEPGLDGVPGRNGADGIPGRDGTSGRDGIPGRSGVNGTDGRPGSQGPAGPVGPPGVRGVPGPRGKPGTAGRHGTPGQPGVTAYRASVNGTPTDELLIPPAIPGSGLLAPQKPIVVEEGKNVRLRCAATGHPRPTVVWRKLQRGVISQGRWEVNYEVGHTLNLTRINREQMGDYMCIADNGLPPPANQTFTLEVHFSPLIRIRQQMVGAVNGSTVRLECDVEAFPEPVLYWEGPGGRLLDSQGPQQGQGDTQTLGLGLEQPHGPDKHRADHTEPDGYRTRMRLNITRMGPGDFGKYKCVAKNEMGLTSGDFDVHETDPRLATPPPMQVGRPVTFGDLPPDLVSQDDLCPPPPPPQCPACPAPKDVRNVTELRCRDSGHELGLNLVVRMFYNRTYFERTFSNGSFPGYPNRTTNCKLYAVGKPVFHRFTDEDVGSWMRDPLPSLDYDGENYWATKQNDTHTLYEFANKTAFKADSPTRKIKLLYPFEGNSHVVFNGSFFYADDEKHIVRLELATETAKVVELPDVGDKLYSLRVNQLDFSVDDNGLWVIYALNGSNNTIVMKVDAFSHNMHPQYMWNISLNHNLVGEMFIACGVLYAVDSVVLRTTNIRFAFDLYNNIVLDVTLPFTNPFRKTTMLGYNHRHKELYTWDKGNQLTYPVRYHELDDYKNHKEEKGEPEASALEEKTTGYDIEDPMKNSSSATTGAGIN